MGCSTFHGAEIAVANPQDALQQVHIGCGVLPIGA
jgi:hypothetical protein